jgi:hypothetical protein
MSQYFNKPLPFKPCHPGLLFMDTIVGFFLYNLLFTVTLQDGKKFSAQAQENWSKM